MLDANKNIQDALRQMQRANCEVNGRRAPTAALIDLALGSQSYALQGSNLIRSAAMPFGLKLFYLSDIRRLESDIQVVASNVLF